MNFQTNIEVSVTKLTSDKKSVDYPIFKPVLNPQYVTASSFNPQTQSNKYSGIQNEDTQKVVMPSFRKFFRLSTTYNNTPRQKSNKVMQNTSLPPVIRTPFATEYQSSTFRSYKTGKINEMKSNDQFHQPNTSTQDSINSGKPMKSTRQVVDELVHLSEKRNKEIPQDVLETAMQPIFGIKEMIKDTPDEINQKNLLKLFNHKPCYRNRKLLRQQLTSFSPKHNKTELKEFLDPTKALEQGMIGHCSRILQITEELKNSDSIKQMLEINRIQHMSGIQKLIKRQKADLGSFNQSRFDADTQSKVLKVKFKY